VSLPVIQAIRAKYPTPLGTRHGEFLLECAAATGLHLLRKDFGTFVVLPDGTGVAQDILMKPNGVHYDILFDGENTAKPTFDLVANPDGSPLLVDPARIYLVQPSAGTGGSTPPPPTPAPAQPVDLTPILQRLDAIGGLIAELIERDKLLGDAFQALVTSQGSLIEKINMLSDNVGQLAARPYPAYKGRIGTSMRFTPDI
jgi:hypothetical protein